MANTLLWYDLETFGLNPRSDRIAQFAAVRTNDKFEIIDDPIILYCKISPETIPDPMACMVTGITPQETLEKGLSEYEFMKAIDYQFSASNTCVVGFNSIRFDDEFIRHLYYRNFMDPYLREWTNGNSRWDIIDLVRATHDLRPEGINWPKNNWGYSTIKLEKLTEANGISHENAHDALSDVYATIAIAKLIQEKQPRLFKYVFDLRKKDKVRSLLNIESKEPVVHTSQMFQNKNSYTTLVSPLGVDPTNRNCIYSFDLRYSPTDLIMLPVEEVRRRVFTPEKQLGVGEKRVPLKGIHINKCPFVAPLSTLTDEVAIRLGINKQECLKHYDQLKNNSELIQKIREIFAPNEAKSLGLDDVDSQLYSAFFRDDDKAAFKLIHSVEPEKLVKMELKCHDNRVPELWRRFKGRNFLELLDENEQKWWKNYCAARMISPRISGASDFGEFKKRLDNYRNNSETTAAELRIVKALSDWADIIESKYLT